VQFRPNSHLRFTTVRSVEAMYLLYINCAFRMATKDEQVEMLVTADNDDHAKSSPSSRAAVYHGHNQVDFDVKYGRKADVDITSCCDRVLASVRNMECKRERVLSFIQRHVPAVKLIRTYKVYDILVVDLDTLSLFCTLAVYFS